MQINLEELSLVELRAIAKEKGIKNIQKFRKHELMDILKDSGDVADELAAPVEDSASVEEQKSTAVNEINEAADEAKARAKDRFCLLIPNSEIVNPKSEI